MKFRRSYKEQESSRALPEMITGALNQLDQAALVIAPGDMPIFSSHLVAPLGILREGKIHSEELLAITRVVRRTNKKQSGQITIARGPIGEGTRELSVTVIPLTENELVLALLSDESESIRIQEMRRDFVANISHELKTPIGALSLLSEAVLEALEDKDAVRKFAERMQIEAKRLTDMVQEIINLSKLQDSDPLKVPQEFGVDDLIREAIDQCSTKADARRVWITYEHSVNVSVLGDREQLIMAIHNLIENAINYSPEDTKVTLTTKIEDDIVDISVTDQGIGIADPELDRIFERFYRVDPARSRQTGGTGLGLSIVKHVVTKHGGEIKVWSSPGVGSTFSIRLPIVKEEKS